MNRARARAFLRAARRGNPRARGRLELDAARPVAKKNSAVPLGSCSRTTRRLSGLVLPIVCSRVSLIIIFPPRGREPRPPRRLLRRRDHAGPLSTVRTYRIAARVPTGLHRLLSSLFLADKRLAP